MTLRPIAMVLVVQGLLACDAGPEHELSDEGRVCLEPHEVENGDSTLTVTVTAEDCLPGCAKNIEESCTAQLEAGGTIRVHSDFSWEEDDGICTAICQGLQARCLVDGVTPGVHEVQHGSRTFSFEHGAPLADACPDAD